jgi:hypothetical protein
MKSSKFHSRGAREEFSWENIVCNNVLTVRPIFTNNKSIDLDWQGEKSRIIKKVPKFSQTSVLIDSIQHGLRKTANIIGKKTSQFKASCLRTRRNYKGAGLIKRQKSFQGLAMYGHEVLMYLQTRAKLFGTHLFLFHVSDIRLYRMTVYSMEKCKHHCQATSFMSDLDDVNFPLTIANCFSPFGSHLNSIGVI